MNIFGESINNDPELDKIYKNEIIDSITAYLVANPSILSLDFIDIYNAWSLNANFGLKDPTKYLNFVIKTIEEFKNINYKYQYQL